jgi:hypothetical protein
MGDDDREHRPGDRLAPRKGQRQERERHREQQAMGVGTVAQGLQCSRAKAPCGYYVIEIQRRATDEREHGEEDSPVAAQHDRQDHEKTYGPMNQHRSRRGESRMMRRCQEGPAVVEMHPLAGLATSAW